MCKLNLLVMFTHPNEKNQIGVKEIRNTEFNLKAELNALCLISGTVPKPLWLSPRSDKHKSSRNNQKFHRI